MDTLPKTKKKPPQGTFLFFLWVEYGALAYAKAHVTAGKALVKHYRLALRSPHAKASFLWGPIYNWVLAETHSIKNKISNHKGC